MSYTLQLTLAAQDDLTEAVSWYDEKSEALGDRFLEAVHATFLLLEQHPSSYQKRFKNVRQILIKQFPFALHYLLEEPSKTVTVIAVLHTSRNPQIWKDRL